MNRSVINRIDYLIALIAEFAEANKLSAKTAYEYLQKYHGIDFAEEFYDVEHTLSFDDAVEDVKNYCKRMGGYIV